MSLLNKEPVKRVEMLLKQFDQNQKQKTFEQKINKLHSFYPIT